MSRHIGLEPVHARDQLQKAYPPAAGIQPLPAGTPDRATAADVGIRPSAPISFLVIGDHGGVKDPNPQQLVVNAMAATSKSPATAPAFVYTVGDVVYFNGDASEYAPQFYEPYAHIVAPFVGIPGNHDGDTTDDPSRPPLDTFMANFCASSPGRPPADPQDEYGRDTQTQPWCDWTLADPGLPFTIIGLYSNVPSGGHLDPSQTAWLVTELQAAATDRPLIVSLHHPPYSIDAHHGGSARMGAALDAAFESAKRCPDLVLSGHVHDYQRFTRSFWGKQITYVVIGNSGYHNLHQLAPGATPGQTIPGADPSVVYEAGDDQNFGFLSCNATAGELSFEYVQVPKNGSTPKPADSFTVQVSA